MRVKLLIAGEEIEGIESAEIASTFGASPIGEIEVRSGVYSNSFTIPRTLKNRRILGFPDIPTAQTEQPYKKLEAEILVEGVSVVYGFAVIEQASDVYELAVYGGNSSFFSQIKEKTLRDLDLSAFYHLWNADNIDANRENLSGFIYANADFGNLTGKTNPLNVSEFFPSVYFGAIFDAISDLTRYKITKLGNFPEEFERAVIPFSGPYMRQGEDKDFYLKARISADIAVPAATWTDIAFDVIDEKGKRVDFSDLKNYKAALMERIFTPTLVIDWGGSSQNIDFRVLADGATVINSYTQSGSGINFIIPSGFVSNPNFYESLKVQVYAPNGCTIKKDAVISSQPTETSLEVLGFAGYMYPGETVILEELLPNVKISDFLKYCANAFNLIFDTNPARDEIKVFPFDHILENAVSPVDWSSKLVLDEEPRVSFRFKDYARENVFKYADSDSETLNELSRDSLFIEDETIEERKEVFEAVFEPSETGSSFDSDLVKINTFSDPGDSAPSQDAKARVCLVSFDTKTNLELSGKTSPNPQARLIFEGLEFSKLLPKYYGGLREVLSRSKYVEALFMLNARDIASLDFSRPVYVDKLGGLYYLDEIEQFKATSKEPTLVKLCKL